MPNSKATKATGGPKPSEPKHDEPTAGTLNGGEPKPKADAPKTQVERLFGVDRDSGQPTLKVRAELELPEHAEVPSGEITAKDAKDAVDAILNALGTDKFPATQFPTPRRNNGAEASNFVLWEHVSKVATKKFKAATQAAENSGVFGDPESYVPGETTMVYNSPEFVISVKKGDDTRMVDRELVTEVLKEVAPGKWQELLERCKKPRAGPTQRIVSLK